MENPFRKFPENFQKLENTLFTEKKILENFEIFYIIHKFAR
jgi:hypothetical protein